MRRRRSSSTAFTTSCSWPTTATTAITVYGRTATGNVAPLRSLFGVQTGLSQPQGLVVDTVHDELVVTNGGNNTVTVYARTAQGPAVPIRILVGTVTGLSAPAGLVVTTAPIADADGDGVADDADNCLTVANPDQRDSNADGFGNLCDADLDNDCTVNFIDLGLMKSVFFSADPDADLDGDGSVNFVDLGKMDAAFFHAPGPSGVPNLCDTRNP